MQRCITHLLGLIIVIQVLLITPAVCGTIVQGGVKTRMNTNQTINSVNVRFQVLSETLIRMEYSPTGTFEDAPTVSVLNRNDWQDVSVKSQSSHGWLEINTDKMSLRYKIGSGSFNAENLTIAWKGSRGESTWRPGDKDDANLGGVLPTMDNITEFKDGPGTLSKNGYFMLDDSRSPIRDAKSKWITPRKENDSQDWYFFVYNHDYPHMLGELAKLLGPIPMIPRYMLGAWFTSRADYAQNQWEMIADQFRERSLPLDIFVLDSCSWTNSIWSGYDWDYEQLPDPKGFFAWCKERGIKVSMNEHYAALTLESDHSFETIRKNMGLPTDTEEIPHNLADKKYADMFMNQLHKPAFDMGLSFWWQDGWADAKMEGLDDALWTREIEYLGSEKITGKRTFMFCRLGSGWGSHRYGSYFTGDMTSNWPTLELMVDSAIKGGNMLVAWVNHDTGAIFGVKIDDELYLRWLQFGAFNPIFRLHSLWGMRLPWEYGDAGVACYKKFAGLRYSLLPYIYSYARTAHDTAMPLVSGMYLQYPEQENAYKYTLQYMFGKEILVAPITETGGGKPVSKDVFLPAGENWFDYFTGAIYKGGQVISYECPLERMPLFVRAGSVIPMAPDMDFTDQKPVDPLTLDVYAGKPSEFKLYEDDGISFDYKKGGFAWTTINFEDAEKSGDYYVNIAAVKGKFKGQLSKRRYIIKIHGLLKPESISLNDRVIDELSTDDCKTGWAWDKESRVTTIHLRMPLPVNKNTVISVKNAGLLADSLVLQKVLVLREKVRKVKFLEKLKYAELLRGADHCKPPRVIRKIEVIEQQLNDLVAKPKGIGKKAPKYDAMVETIIASFTDQPFEAARTIPDLNESSRASEKAIADGTFTQEELDNMIKILKGEK
ncbi:MAG: glycoside hydrolase family 31 protein [Armatimonadota bacterium]